MMFVTLIPQKGDCRDLVKSVSRQMRRSTEPKAISLRDHGGIRPTP